MSRRKPKRRHSKLSEAAVMVHISDMCCSIDNPSGFISSDVGLLVSQTAKILSLATNESSERKALTQRTSNGISILLKALKLFDDISMVANIISILDVLASHRYTGHLVRMGVVSAVMLCLSELHRSARNLPDPLTTSILSLLYKLSVKDKRFGVKARLSGILSIIVGLLKKYHDDIENQILILALLRPLAFNGLNADSLGKLGCLSLLTKLLARIGQKDVYILNYCINVLTPLLKHRCNVKRPAAQGCVKQLIVLHEHLHRTDQNSRHISLRKNILKCLRFCISTDSNLQVFNKNNGLFILYTTAKQSSEGSNKSSRGIASLTCLVLRKCLPLVPLPLNALVNPTHFPLPNQKALQHVSCSESSSAKTTTTDLSLLLRTSDGAEAHQEGQGVEGERVNNVVTLWELEEEKLKSKCDLDPHRNCSSEPRSLDKDLVPNETLPCRGEGNAQDDDGRQECSGSGGVTAGNDSGGDDGATAGNGRDGDDGATAGSSGGGASGSGGGGDAGGGSGDAAGGGSGGGGEELSHHPIITEGDVIEDIEKCIKLMKFKKFFPELERTRQNYQMEPSQCSSGSQDKISQGPEMKDDPTSDPVSKAQRPVVVVPTAICTNEINIGNPINSTSATTSTTTTTTTEGTTADGIRDIQEACHCAQLVEKPSPQVLGHIPPSNAEPLYTKTLSVDRKLYLSDIGRFIDQKKLINKTVFDLDMCTQETSAPQTSSELGEPLEIILDTPLRLNVQEITGDLVSEGASSNVEIEVDTTDPTPSSNDVRTMIQPGEGSVPHLEFESRFESGNLRKAVQIRPYEYDLLLNADINTNHHHQWFYFRVSNTKPNIPYRFNIINCEKPNSQFNFGMQPVVYSTTEFQRKQQGDLSRKKKSYYTLTFTLIFQHVKDTCYIAYHYPYTYSMLKFDLEKLEEDIGDRGFYYHRQPLCTTLCGNMCPLITISSNLSSGVGSELEDKENKKYIVLSARVHPGESNSSWIMKGVLQHLTSDHPTALLLRENYVFKIIPMLNPDGVIHGSHRCSLSGEDLNRQWLTPNPDLHSTIYYTKSLLQWLVATNRKPEVYCDFHGHSRKKNIFMYGCRNSSGSNIEQVLPRHLDRIAPLFSYGTCSFAIEKSKEATARVVVWRELGVARSYTMESTYCGADQGQLKGRHIGTSDLENMGELFCEGLQLLEEQSEYAGSDSDVVREKKEGSPSCHSDSSYKSSTDASSTSSHESS